MTQSFDNNNDDNKNRDNILKVANVSVALHAELGRTKLQLKDVVEYDSGSIIQLDKTTDEPVELFVDDILIAKGKIVAIEDTYGIKIVELIENKENTQNIENKLTPAQEDTLEDLN